MARFNNQYKWGKPYPLRWQGADKVFGMLYPRCSYTLSILMSKARSSLEAG